MRPSELALLAGTFAFAAAGTLKARSYRMDFVGAVVLAFVTAYGGGTLRDLLIDAHPISWMNNQLALGLVASAVLLVFLLKQDVSRFTRIFFFADAIGVGLFTIGGIERSLEHGADKAYAVLLGVVSATFGGLLADVLSSKVPDLLKPGEWYAIASLLGGIAYMGLAAAGLNAQANMGVSVTLVVAIRVMSRLQWLRSRQI